MIRIASRKDRYHWKGAAAANFFLGGTGAGLFIFYWLASFWGAEQLQPAPAPSLVILAVVLLVGAGFVAVALEAGRPLRGPFVFLNFSKAWMSREILFGSAFIILCVIYGLAQLAVFMHLAALSAGLLIFSQSMVLYRSVAIAAWNTLLLPLLLISMDLCLGYGAGLLLGLSAKPVIIYGLLAIVLQFGLSISYRNGAAFGFDPRLKPSTGHRTRWPKTDIAGLGVPFVLSLVLLAGYGVEGTVLPTVCGLLILFGLGGKVYNIVCKSDQPRKIIIDEPIPEIIRNRVEE